MQPNFDNTAIAVVSFLIGNVTGFIFCRILSKTNFNFDADSKLNWLIIVVSIMWVTSVLVDIVSPVYETSPLIHGIMGAIVGFFFYKPKT